MSSYAYELESRLRKLEGGAAAPEPKGRQILTLVDFMEAVEAGEECNFDTTPEPLLRLLNEALQDEKVRREYENGQD